MTTTTKTPSLYEMTAEIADIIYALDAIEEPAPDATDDERTAHAELLQRLYWRLDVIEGGMEAKVDACGKILADREGLIERAETEAERLKTMAKTLSNRNGRLKDYLRRTLSEVSQETVRVQGELFAVTLTRQGPPAPKVVDEDKVPNEWRTAILEVPLPSVPPALRDSIKGTKVRRADVQEYVEQTGDLVEGVELVAPTRQLRGLPGSAKR